jgi:hypothetical protein
MISLIERISSGGDATEEAWQPVANEVWQSSSVDLHAVSSLPDPSQTDYAAAGSQMARLLHPPLTVIASKARQSPSGEFHAVYSLPRSSHTDFAAAVSQMG